MRIHVSNDVTSEHVWQAINIAGAYGTVTEHKSRSHGHAFEVTLEGNSRRRPQGGSRDAYAATWDSWGVFIAGIFALDENAKMTYYRDAFDFHYQTSHRFDADNEYNRNPYGSAHWPNDSHGDHTFRHAGISYEQSCTKCSAVKVYGRAQTFANV